jgi:hypothetical protein
LRNRRLATDEVLQSCGALVSQSETGELKASEKRFDEYLDGLFWITVFGLAFILGGAVLLKKVILRDAFIVAYLALSTTVFLINFGLRLWGAFRIARKREGSKTQSRVRDAIQHQRIAANE